MEKYIGTRWFESPLGPAEDPWTLSTLIPDHPHHRDACIGNGLIGTRINAEGTADGYRPGSSSFMSGLWGAATENPDRPQGLIELPHWATLRIEGGDRELRRSLGEIFDRRQNLNLRTATVTTSWVSHEVDGSSINRKIEVWMARADPHIAVIDARVRTDGHSFPATVSIEEVLDSMHIPDTSETSTNVLGEDLVMALISRKFGHHLVVRSRLLISGGDGLRIFSTVTCDPRRAIRRLQLSGIRPGEEIRVEKVVAIVSSKQHADPEKEAGRQLDAACADLSGVRKRHVEGWAHLWTGRIESSHPRLKQLANSCLYHLYSTVREETGDSHGPCGLFGNGWDGHVFWDTDLWTQPVLALFNPSLARSCAAYRHRTLGGARENAVREGEAGARYGWMTGETGAECCSQRVFQEERHIVSCVALGQWLYAVGAGDEDWLAGEGLEVLTGCAEYWVSRAVKDADGRYHILKVCGPDEHAGCVDDNAVTNWGAAWTLRKAAELTCQQGNTPPPVWQEIADGLVMLEHPELKIPLQMRQWREDQTIKQADATLLVHPWHFPLDEDKIEKMVDYYRANYPDQPIMMGAAIDGILDGRLGRSAEVTRTFEELLPYFRPPFLVTTEAPSNERLVFLTGMGGFLQFIAMGMAGLITDEWSGLRSGWACLPDGLDDLTLHGVHHRGGVHEVTVSRDSEGCARVKITTDAQAGAPVALPDR